MHQVHYGILRGENMDMTYRKYKNGTFKVSEFLTILIEALTFIREDRGSTTILGIYFSDW